LDRYNDAVSNDPVIEMRRDANKNMQTKHGLRWPKLTGSQIVIPQVDARLRTHYHTTWWPHHLTKTIMY